MFLFPISKWVGGILYEHSHRLLASFVGVLVVALTRWLCGSQSRRPLAVIGAVETIAGLLIPHFAPQIKGAGYFLSGIGSIVLIAAIVWVRNEPSAKPLPLLGWIAFGAVQVQGLLGGLRVVLSRNEIGIFHAALAQAFFVLLCAIALLTAGWWQKENDKKAGSSGAFMGAFPILITCLIFVQLVLGATMRHQHAGLAIPDFPLAYGKVWPATDSASVEVYNAKRIESTTVNPITPLGVELQMSHRLLALIIFVSIGIYSWRTVKLASWKSVAAKVSGVWLGLVLLQAILGAATIWSNKAADIATAHVVVGALLLANGALVCLILRRTALAPQTMGLAASTQDSFSARPVTAGAKS
jgi:cytochrome c oxidase assembly protein subunit 15